jgi:hypothetical protein
MDAERPLPRLPLPLRAVNLAGALLERVGRRPIDLSEPALLEAARRATGLDDFGEPWFREGLRALLASYEEGGHLTTFGRLRARNECIRLLANRLRIEDDRRRFPEIARERIAAPIFIVGLPRTGTTLLHHLLAQDPAHRVLAVWEVLAPSPPPRRETRDTDPRRAAAERSLRRFERLAPEFAAIHPIHASGPEECVNLFNLCFASMQFETASDVPTYAAWLERQDLRAAYAYYRELLKLLQWRCPAERWVLKSPAHLFALDALLETFPDACVVQTHRDPLRVLPSQCSLVAHLRVLGEKRVEPQAIGREVPATFARGVERAMAVRARTGEERFTDVHYRELVRDPLAAVRAIYERFGLRLEPRAEAAMKSWLAANPQGKHGAHRYTLEQFGLDAAIESRRFAAYRERFRIAVEPG